MYNSTRADTISAYTIGIIYAVLAIGLAIMLFKIWPPIPWPTPEHKQQGVVAALLADTNCPMPPPSATPAPASRNTETNPQNGAANNEIIRIPISVMGRCWQTTFDERLLMLVIVAGILGAFVHGATSLADYIGNNSFSKSWTWFYLLRPAIGMSLALVFYFVIRGGFLSTTGGAQDINPYGIAALSGLVGMFSKQATDKLSEVFATLFRSAPGRGDAKRQHPLTQATIALIQIDPVSVIAGGDAFKLTVSGAGFVDGATIHVDDVAQPTTFESANKLSTQIPPEKIANPLTLKITVFNPDATIFGPVDLIVSAGDGGDEMEETSDQDESVDEELVGDSQ